MDYSSYITVIILDILLHLIDYGEEWSVVKLHLKPFNVARYWYENLYIKFYVSGLHVHIGADNSNHEKELAQIRSLQVQDHKLCYHHYQ